MRIGYFGKLPAYGDFIQRNINPAIIDYLDNWILQAFDNSQNTLEKGWRNAYFTAPIWRFYIDAGIVSRSALTGLMMPSVDKAGRCYPFFVVGEFSEHTDIFKLAISAELHHLDCEDYLLHLLETEHTNLDDITKTLVKLYQPLNKSLLKKAEYIDPNCPNEIFKFSPLQENSICEISQECLSKVITEHYAGISIWHRSQSEKILPQYRFFKGMPTIQTYLEFLAVDEN
ncbi:type VI secretion system-associated protein TagF [Glaciecola sp. 1036]|uniref:type VI secretion system-associated protein TagF n=1 Tax=Alteromonadaceae TaxID=72275 RepID=UPI003D03BF2F